MKPLSKTNFPKAILRDYFGYDTFREHQEEIIQLMISGQDTFVLMPTGSGKSLCYQIPSMIRDGVGIVISPLIALMQDQVDALRQVGIRADFINSSLTIEGVRKVSQRVISGETDLLYVAPERLMTTNFQRFLSQIHLALFAIDEAHCVSQWGHDFRPEYLQISFLLERFPAVPKIALTATADSVTRREILEKLNLKNAGQFVSSFDRPNICYRVELKQKGRKQLADFLRTEHPKDSGIIYCLSRKKTEATATWLAEKGYTAFPYHAGMDQASRLRNQRCFLQDESVIIVATIAFGMGIDKPDVRFVAHLDMPKSVEAYYQETGRSGRDGQPADAWMVYSLADVVRLRRMLAGSQGDQQFKMIQQQKIEAMLGFCETTRCRRQVLLGYFGEDLPLPCGNCDTCQGKVETWEGTLVAQKALSCVWRTGQRFGASYLSDVLLGKSDERILRFRHDKVSTFGIGHELSKKEWGSVFRQLVAAGFLCVDLEGKGGFSLSPQSRPVLKGEQKVWFRKDPAPVKIKRRFRSENEQKKAFDDPASMLLWEELRDLRLNIAREKNIPPYIIFHDSTLRELVLYLPQSLREMESIYGIGHKKLELYGGLFLKVLQRHFQKYGIPENLSEQRRHIESVQNSTDSFTSTVSDTLILFKKGMTPEQIAEYRKLKISTIYTHFSQAIEENAVSVEEILPLKKEEILEIEKASSFQPPEEKEALTPILERFGEKYDFGILRCVRAGMLTSDMDKAYDVEQIRNTFPKAYAKWTDEDDNLLKTEYQKGKGIETLAEMFQRKPGAIRSRLQKLEPMQSHKQFQRKSGAISSRLKKLEQFQKQLICLANSRKYSGYCVAGKEFSENRIGRWIRPVSNRDLGVLLINDMILENGEIPKMLDIITVSLIKPDSHSYQTENYVTDTTQAWVKTGEVPISDLPKLCDNADVLWLNRYHSHHGFNDRIPEEMADEILSSSLLFIKPENAFIRISEELYNKKIRAVFHFNGISYCLVITDPAIEARYLRENVGEYSLGNVFFTVSLSEPYNGYCYKLVAGIIG